MRRLQYEITSAGAKTLFVSWPIASNARRANTGPAYPIRRIVGGRATGRCARGNTFEDDREAEHRKRKMEGKRVRSSTRDAIVMSEVVGLGRDAERRAIEPSQPAIFGR